MDEDYLIELFEALGPVRVKRMFGGQGVWVSGVIVAVVVDGELLLKADAESVPDFEAAGCEQWTYEAKGKSGRMPYWSVPSEAFDDASLFEPWARRAYEAGLRATKANPKRN